MDLLDLKWKIESLNLVKDAKARNKEPKCHVDFSVDSVGSISAMVYGENGVASAKLCYNDDTSRSKGAFMLEYSIPELDKMMKAYSKESGVPIEKINPNDERFIKWMKKLMKKSPDEQWDLTKASWTSGKFETYASKEDALDALLNGEALGLGMSAEERQPE